MSAINPIEQVKRGADINRIVLREIDTVRKAWRLTTPEANYRDPQWLKSAASQAAKAGTFPKRKPYQTVLDLIFYAGYHAAIDHPAVIRIDGERHVILEPYESSCSMDTARRIAAELSTRLGCDAWASLKSWHFPGRTIRITLAPKRNKQRTTIRS